MTTINKPPLLIEEQQKNLKNMLSRKIFWINMRQILPYIKEEIDAE